MKSFYKLFLLQALLILFTTQVNAAVTAVFFKFENPTCFGATDGYVTVDSLQSNSATPSYTISVNTSPVTFFNVGDTVYGLGSGSYSLTIRDNGVLYFPLPQFVINEPFQVSTLILPTPASCFDTCDGSATVFIGNGTPPYTVLWSDPLSQDSTTVLGLCDGKYYVTVTDTNGCFVIDSMNILQPTELVPNVTVTDVACFGDNTGSAVSNATGGSGTYANYDWSSSANNTSTETGLIAGTYTVTVTDNTGCIGIETFIVDEPNVALTVSLTKSDVFCFGDSTGLINTARSGGTTPYTYAWSDGPVTTRNRTILKVGTYTVTVTDNNGCTETASTTINSRPAISVGFVKVDNVCFGGGIGSVAATISGGTTNYTFVWSESTTGTGATTSISNLIAGTYTITVTDALSCTFVDSVEILEPTEIDITIDTQTDPLCNGTSDGSIDISVSGGTPAYTYIWSESSTTQDISGLPAGTYTVTVSDNNGCSMTESVTLNDPTVLAAAIDSLEDASCNGFSDGFARVLASGGTGAYTYLWSNSPTTAANPNLSAASYTVTVTDANGCTITTTANVGQPVAVVASITSTDASCAGINDGTATASGSGGTTPYTFAWSTTATTASISSLMGGTYTVTVTDSRGCADTESVVILQPSAIGLTTSAIDADCFGASTGTASVSASGGTPNYTYLWDVAANSQSTATATLLSSGTYRVTVSDANGCNSIDSATVGEPTAVTANINSTTDPACNGGTNGLATVTAGGGTPNYTYLWDASTGNQTTATATGLAAGTYTVTVSDANSCTGTDQVTLVAPTALTVLADSLVNVSCNGLSDGFLRVTSNGGTPNYTYAWNIGGSGDTKTGLVAGTYTVTVTDANACTGSQTFVITEPAILTVTLAVTDEQCDGADDGEITATPAGGNMPYTYLWSPFDTTQTISNLSAGVYSLTITDNNGCTATQSGTVDSASAIVLNVTATDVLCKGGNDGSTNVAATGGTGVYTYEWSNNPTTASNPNLIAGTYTITVTDGNGCTNTQSVLVDEPDTLKPSLTTVDVGCGATNNGSATVSTTGGTTPYTFLWGPGNPIGQGTNSISGLTANTYSLTVTDRNGCDSIQSFTINNTTANFSFVDSIDNVSCFGLCDGRIRLFGISGGTSPYTFAWDDATSLPSRSNLCEGNYSLTLSDANGCDSVIAFVITQPDSINVNITTIDESCIGSDGEADASTSTGGTSPYTYAWSMNAKTSSSIDSLVAGTYFLTLTDANGCSKVESFTINSGSGIDDRETIVDASCQGKKGGSITLSPQGGVAPYNFVWDDNSTQFFRTAIGAGSYTVTITDASTPACSIVETYVVGEPDTIKPVITVNSGSCGTSSNGSASVVTSGGTLPYTFLWGPGNPTGQGTNTISGLATGTYSLTVTDGNGCDTIQSFVVGAGVSNFVFSDSTRDNTCFGGCIGFAGIFNLSGGTTPYTFNWDDASSLSSRNNLCEGNYSVTISDANGCDSIVSFVITEPNEISAIITSIPDTCVAKVGNASVVVTSGGTAPFTFNWPVSGVANGNAVDSLFPGNYQLTITDASGCTSIKDFVIGNVAPFAVNIASRNITCNGDKDGEIDVSTVGGTNPLTYQWNAGTHFLVGANPRNVAPGFYTITITDANGCANVKSILITEPDTLLVDFIISNDSSCSVVKEGMATAFGRGGTMPYTYTWGAGIPSGNSTSDLAAGSYFLTISDSKGCSYSESFTIGSDAPFDVDVTSTDASCNGGTDGTISVATSGSIPPLTYDWNIGSNLVGPNPTMVATGVYRLTVTDGTGCSQTTAVFVAEAEEIIDSLVIGKESCAKDDGYIRVISTGGVFPHTYNWDPIGVQGQGTDSIFGLAAGNYRLTITDAGGCTKALTVGLQGGSDIGVTSDIIPPTCFGDCDASLTIHPDGGVKPYTFLWDDSSTDSTRTNLCIGSYRVTITDNATPPCTKVEIVGVSNRPVLIIKQVLSYQERCVPGNDGSAAAIVEGGVSPYTYSWSSGNQNAGNAVFDLSAGTHTVTVTDANGCTTSESFLTTRSPDIIITTTSTEPSCNGAADGTINVLSSSGYNPLTYSWAGGFPVGADPVNVPAGTYTITIIDLNGCEGSSTITLGEPEPITDTLAITDESCTPGSDGGAVASPTGGTPPYTYAWPPLGTSSGNMITGLQAGTYNVTVTDDSACVSVIPFTIGSTAPFSVTITLDSVTCRGGSDGSITVITTASNPSFTWATLPNLPNHSLLEAGTYFLTVTDGVTGCKETETVIVLQPDTFLSNEVITNVSCNGNGSDGEIDLNVSGGTSPYTYSWNGNVFTEDRTNLSVGNYDVTVTDSKGCQYSESFTISNETPITVELDSVDVRCNGGSNGSITLTTTSLNPTYSWSPSVPFPNQGNQNGLGANTYKVTVTDAITGCTATDSVTINQPTPFLASFNTTPESCSPGGDGTAIAMVSGGTPAYSYTWPPSGTAIGASVSGLAAGNFNLTITDRRGCTSVQPFTIGSAAPFTVNFINVVAPNCNGDSTGQFGVSVVGAGGPLTYDWDPNYLPNQANQIGLPSGTYSVTITDQADGCTSTNSIVINEPTLITASAAITPESCNPGVDGAIDITVSGGTVAGAYAYNWSANAPNATSEDQTGLAAGTYEVTITDDNGCVALDTFIVGSSAPFSVTVNKTDIDCNGDNDGTITITTSGPVSGTLSYTWSPVQPNSPNLTGLTNGTYNLTITDSGNGCMDTRSITINEPSLIVATLDASSAPESCSPGNDGSLIINVSGGTSTGGIYFYNWSGVPAANRNNKNQSNLASGAYNVTITDDNACTIVKTFNVGVSAPFDVDLDSTDVSCFGLSDGSIRAFTSASNPTYAWSANTNAGNTNNPTSLPAGTYTVTVTEPSSGCAESVSIVVNEPGKISAILTPTNSTCGNSDGSIRATGLTGGTAPISITWLDATKASIGQIGNNATGLAAGTYFAAFSDINGCADTSSVQVNDDLGPTATIAGTDVTCANTCDGTATVTSACLSTTCIIEWKNSAGITIGTSATITGLCPGEYFAKVTDNATTCVTNLSIIIVTGASIDPVLTTIDNDCSIATVCSGSAKSVPTGGTAPYTYAWSGPISPISGQGTDSIFNLCPGNYDLNIIDANGCDTTINFVINPRPIILPNASSTNETCVGASDGTISLAPSGGITPYTYNWSPVPGNGQGVEDANGLTAQVYSVTISDANGCDTSISITIGTGSFNYSIAKTDLSCNNVPDGSALVSIVGGSTGYSFNWDPIPGNGQGTSNASGLNSGKYYVTITSGGGCTALDSVTIDPSSPILPNESFTDETCAGLCNGTISLSASGGAGSPYTYTWSPIPPNGQGVANATGLCSGVYSITVSDASVCDTVISITIQGSTVLVTAITAEDMTCNNSSPCDGRAFASVSGGASPYTYNWSAGNVSGVNGDTVDVLCAGTYAVTITDANGCSVVEPVIISAPPAINTSFTKVNSSCNLSDGSLTVTASGGTPGYTYAWFDSGMNPLSSTSPTVSAIPSGIYFVEITDAIGCSDRFSVGLSDDGGEAVTMSQTDVTCYGGSDGTAKATYSCGDPSCIVAWFDGTTGQPLNVTIDSVDNLKAGSYFVQVTNNSGCKTFENVIITQPDPFAITANIVDETCNNGCNGSISVNVTGGTGALSYNWAPGPLVGQGTNGISNLCSGAYSLTVTDANGCDSVFAFIVGQPTAMTSTFTMNESNCSLADGSITATINGGTVAVDYDYQWFDGSNVQLIGETNATINNISAGTYQLRVRDDNVCEERFTAVLGTKNGPSVVVDSTKDAGCFGGNNGAAYITATGNNNPLVYDWLSQGQTTEDITNISAGTYTVQVTDALGCTTAETVSIVGSPELLANITTDDASCGLCNGEADLAVSGGTAPYTYLWSNGSVVDTTGSLCGGLHSVVITDANGCSITEIFSINTNGGPTGETVTVTASSCATSCDGTATVTPIGGTAPFTYLWQHNGATTNNLTGLCKGTYFLQISDVRGCSRNVKVEVDSPNELVIQEQVTGTQCNLSPCEGTINLNVSGGQKPYTYNWGPSPQNDSNFISALCAGVYNVTVSDANGCSETKTISISNNGNPINANPIVTEANCFGSCDGSLESNITSSSSVSFRWLDDQGVAIAASNVDLINTACAGDYILEITSLPAGCKSYTNVTLEEPDTITLAAAVVRNISCAGSCDGEVFISSQGGSILFTYAWSDPNSQTEVPATGLCAGIYSVTATDANGCTATSSVNLIDPPVLVASISGASSVGCSSTCDASATGSATGGVSPYAFDWDGGQNGSNPTTLCFGRNILTVTDATGCVAMDTVFIAATDTVIAEVPTNSLICDGDSIYLDGTIIGSTINFVGWYESDSVTLITNITDTAIIRPIGDYRFYLIASNGNCSDTTEYVVKVVESPKVGVPSPIAIYKDEVAQIEVTNQDPMYMYNWNPGTDLTDSTIAEPISSTRKTIIYTLTVRDTNNCTYLDSVEVIYSPDVDIPSGFSPNGDGKNDVWRIRILDEFPGAMVQVYNRWGELMYEQTNGYKIPWDGTYEGKALPIGTYYYIVDFKTDRFKPMTGPVTIVK